LSGVLSNGLGCYKSILDGSFSFSKFSPDISTTKKGQAFALPFFSCVSLLLLRQLGSQPCHHLGLLLLVLCVVEAVCLCVGRKVVGNDDDNASIVIYLPPSGKECPVMTFCRRVGEVETRVEDKSRCHCRV
jgi:hypothetical protein